MNDLVNSIKDNLNSNLYKSDLGAFTTKMEQNMIFGLPAFIITMHNNAQSTVGARRLIQSMRQTKSFFNPVIYPATTPETLQEDLKTIELDLTAWTWPITPGKKQLDLRSGLELSGYGAKDYTKVVACLISHLRLWIAAAGLNHPIAIFEHDAIMKKSFTRDHWAQLYIKKDVALDVNDDFGIIGLNDPRGATRKSNVYLEKVIEQSTENSLTVPAPWVDSKEIPQGIAGNSAYIIGPKPARKLLNLISEHGLWPNDALMCKQLMGPVLHQAYPFFTGLQGISSTTQG
jgi:GR25 family glycosyltransferase involved in LPS biosynthesis